MARYRDKPVLASTGCLVDRDPDKPLGVEEVKQVLGGLERAAEREACWSCERLQKFIKQLELESADDVRDLVLAYEVRPERLHGSLGCQPCPPADVFMEYIKSRH
jgi:hypothetical protein